MYNFTSDKPIYLQIYDDLIYKIISGHYPLGSRLDSVRELAYYYTVNPNTVQRVISELESQGIVIIERGRGTYLTSDEKILKELKVNVIKQDIKDVIQKLHAIGLTKEEMTKQIDAMMDEVINHDTNK